MPETSLGRLFASCGVPDWEELYPAKICGKCWRYNKNLYCGTPCAALAAIGGVGAMFTADEKGAQDFTKHLRRVVDSITPP